MELKNRRKLFGLIIRNERERQGLTQDELCNRSNIELAQLSNIETGKRFPSIPTLFNIIEILKVEPNELFKFLEYNKKDVQLIDIQLNERIKNLSDDIKYHIYEVLNAIK